MPKVCHIGPVEAPSDESESGTPLQTQGSVICVIRGSTHYWAIAPGDASVISTDLLRLSAGIGLVEHRPEDIHGDGEVDEGISHLTLCDSTGGDETTQVILAIHLPVDQRPVQTNTQVSANTGQ